MRSERAQLAAKKFKRSRRRLRKLKGKHPARDHKYRAFVRAFVCVICFVNAWRRVLQGLDALSGLLRIGEYAEAAHMGPHGVSQKASDYTCIPLCLWHHREAKDSAHKLGRRFAEHHGIDLAALQAKLLAAFREAHA